MILFVNGSPNREGNTAALARKLLKGKDYETLNLIDYKIYPLGQQYDDDQYKEVLRRMHWHSMTGQFRELLDRLYGADMRSLKGKQLYFIFQGAGPSQAMLDAGDYTVRTFCRLAGLEYMGMTTY